MIDWKILTLRKFSPSLGLGGWNKSRKRPLRSFRTYEGMTLKSFRTFKTSPFEGQKASVKFFFKFNLPSIFTKKLVENHEYRTKYLKVRVSRQANYSHFTSFNFVFSLFTKINTVSCKNPFDLLGEQHITLALLSLFSPEGWWRKLLCLLVN